MSDFLKTKVKNLSGGQKQRVALAKVIAKEPEVLLLDEPFSHIDNFRKNKLRRDLFRYLKSKNVLCIVATHDATDALSFADEILVIRDGKLVAKNTPEALYNNLKSEYIGSFFNEVNEIQLSEIDSTSTSKKKVLFYPNQLKLVENSEVKATVITSYFKGYFYLIEANLKGKIIFFEHFEKLQTGSEIYLKKTK
jgi:ABC-type Fe3+/spermidine/putrescine transport system ATPase subunit